MSAGGHSLALSLTEPSDAQGMVQLGQPNHPTTPNPQTPPCQRGGNAEGAGESGRGQRFRDGLVFKAHSLVYHSTLGLGVIKKEKRERRWSASAASYAIFDLLQRGRCKATWKREFKLSWREAGPPNHHDDKVDSVQVRHHPVWYRGTSLIRNRPWYMVHGTWYMGTSLISLGPYGGPRGGGCFL